VGKLFFDNLYLLFPIISRPHTSGIWKVSGVEIGIGGVYPSAVQREEGKLGEEA
jgi:hypothetical protein